MPDDPLKLAREALSLATAATPLPWSLTPPWAGFGSLAGADGGLVFGLAAGTADERTHDAEADAALLGHMGAHYATLARALLSASDRLARAEGLLVKCSWLVESPPSHGPVSDEWCVEARKVIIALREFLAQPAREAGRGE